MGTPGALAHVNDDEIIARIANGEYQSHIARELGVAPPSLHQRISKHPEYQAALEARNLQALDESQGAVRKERERAKPNLARVSAASQEFRSAAWRAERECPQRWGVRQQIEHSGRIDGPSFCVVVAPIQQDAAQQSVEIDVSPPQQIIEK